MAIKADFWLKSPLFPCFVCLIWFFTSHQQSVSYIGTDLPGLNQYLARINVTCSRTRTQRCRWGSFSLKTSTLPQSHCAPSTISLLYLLSDRKKRFWKDCIWVFAALKCVNVNTATCFITLGVVFFFQKGWFSKCSFGWKSLFMCRLSYEPRLFANVSCKEHEPGLVETVPLSTHNICFGWEIRKLNFRYALLTKV